jgi:hypothetical protein
LVRRYYEYRLKYTIACAHGHRRFFLAAQHRANQALGAVQIEVVRGKKPETGRMAGLSGLSCMIGFIELNLGPGMGKDNTRLFAQAEGSDCIP